MKQTDNVEEEYLTPSDVARLMGVAPRTVSRWADEGRITHRVTLGGHRRFLRADIEKLMSPLRRSQEAPTPS